MPLILVIRGPGNEDKVYDRIRVTEDELGDKVEELYEKLDSRYSIEVRYD